MKVTETETAKNTEQSKGQLRRRLFPVLTALAVIAMVWAIVMTSFSDSSFDVEIAQLQDDHETYLGKEVKVSGNVKQDSWTGDADGSTHRFHIEDGLGNDIVVTYAGLLPDPFAYGREVIVEGTLVSRDVVEARNLTVKCPSRYQDGLQEGGDEEMKEHYKDKGVGPAASVTP